MNSWGVPVGVGTIFRYDGEHTQIVEMDFSACVVAVVTKDLRHETIRRFTLNELMLSDRVEMISTESSPESDDLEDVASVVLSAVDEPVRARAFELAAHMREVRTGYRSGSAETALPGEPRPPYRPEVPRMQRYRAKCEELDCGLSTLTSWLKKFDEHGAAGLVSQRAVRSGTGSRTDPRFKEMAREVMAEYINESKPNMARILLTIRVRLEVRYGAGTVKQPCDTTAYGILNDVEREVPLFKHSTKRNRDIADRPKGVYGKLQPTRPGEYLLMDTTRSDVYAMDPHTMTWVNSEVTVVMDWYTRLIVGVRVTPVSTKSIDGACALYQAIRPPPPGRDWKPEAVWPPVGVPRHVLVELEALDRKSACGATPAMVPGTLVIDHGSIFVSEHLTSVCQRMGISIQPARLRTGRDKGPIERFFLTLRVGLLQSLPGYKGEDVNARGLTPERDAWFYVDEVEAKIRAWIAEEYHNTPCDGLRGLEIRRLEMTPAEKWAEGISLGGYLELPRDPFLPLEFLPVEWRTIQKQGVRWEHRFYQHPVLAERVGMKSPYLHMGGKWPIHYNPDDVRTVYMRHPDTGKWLVLNWSDAALLKFPFSQDAMKFQRVLARSEGRYVNGPMAIASFLERHNLSLVNTIKERRIILRMAREQSTMIGDIDAVMSQDEVFDDDGDLGDGVKSRYESEESDDLIVDDLDADEPDGDDFLDQEDAVSDGEREYGDFYADTLEVE
ncbi:Mu transposase C-terminal domain-containing protein [Mycolicibacterium peregrinum]|uniref:Mu transposase C-terminal domain-containing protein n=1 Tax=Mycolicibacterium peregrinum TaxID=43304 RepID=UPI003AAD347D